MTLLERAPTQRDQESIDQRLMAALIDVPGAMGLAVTTMPSGTRALLVIEGLEDERFFDAEELAMERLVSVRRLYPDSLIDLLCLAQRDASGVELSGDARVYAFKS